MKKQINQFVAIAKEYVKVAIELEFEINKIEHIRTEHVQPLSPYNTVALDKPTIKMYFGSDHYTSNFYYGERIEVCGWTGTITMPYKETAKSLSIAITDLQEHIKIFKEFKEASKAIRAEKKKEAIKVLEDKLKVLKND